MADQCPQCGHELAPGPSMRSFDANVHGHHDDVSSSEPQIGPDIGVSSSRPHTSATERRDGPSNNRWIAALLGAAVAAVVLFAVVSGGDSGDIANDTEATDQPRDEAGAVGDGAQGGATNGRDDSLDDVNDSARIVQGADPDFPPSDEHLAADAIAEVFQTSINGHDSYAVAYNSQRGLQILSARGASSPEIEVAVGFDQAARYPLLSDGSKTWAINSRTPDLAYLVSTQFVVIDVGLEGSVAFINNSLDPINIGISSFGAWGPGFNVPAGADLLAVPGRGILVAPATGGTFRLTQLGVTKISDDRVVAAGLNSEVYQRCDDQLECELFVTRLETEDEFVLDIDSASQVYVSPEGRNLLATIADTASIIDIETGEQWTVALPAAATGAGWSPDGRFVAIMANEEIVFAFIDRTQVAMTLPIQPASSSLLVLDS